VRATAWPAFGLVANALEEVHFPVYFVSLLHLLALLQSSMDKHREQKQNLALDEDQLTELGKWIPHDKAIELADHVERFLHSKPPEVIGKAEAYR
jgi:hypothetical protein